MAFPFLFHENFEKGTLGAFTSQIDNAGRLTFPDHNEQLEITPWRGGYCMKVDLNRSSVEEAFVQNDTVLNMASGQTRYIRFYMYISPDFRCPPGASMTFFRCNSAGAPVVEELGIGISRSDNQINTSRLSIRSPDDAEFIDGLGLQLGQWLPIQITVSHNTSTGRVYLHHGNNTVQCSRMAMQPFVNFRLGALAQHEDIRGTLYFDDIIIDVAKLEEPLSITQDQLWGNSQLYTKSTYAFVGPGTLRGATLIGGGSDNLAYFYDANRLPLAHHDIKAALKVSLAESKDSLIDTVMFERGCYIEMTGTNPQVIVHYGVKG